METQSNHVLVGAVTLALLASLAAFIIWIAGLNRGDTKQFDILFAQSVDGLGTGSQVTFSGVPVGQVALIEIWEEDPKFARVRVELDDKVPILEGTAASVQGSFTGGSKILLEGAVSGRPEITCDTTSCPDGVPLIPTQEGGLGAILSNAPLLLERLATLTDRLTDLLSDENQASIAGILANTRRLTDHVADASPQIQATLTELQATLRQANSSLAAFESTMKSTDALLTQDGDSLATDLRETLKSAKSAADALEATMTQTTPAARQLAQSTLPAAEATLRELRQTSEALRKVTEKLDDQGAGALLGGSNLPDYEE